MVEFSEVALSVEPAQKKEWVRRQEIVPREIILTLFREAVLKDIKKRKAQNQSSLIKRLAGAQGNNPSLRIPDGDEYIFNTITGTGSDEELSVTYAVKTEDRLITWNFHDYEAAAILREHFQPADLNSPAGVMWLIGCDQKYEKEGSIIIEPQEGITIGWWGLQDQI